MKVLALTEGPNHVCYRYRIEAFASALRAYGWILESLPLAPGTFQRGPQLRAAADADAVILQRRLLPLWQVRLLRKASRLLLYDFDDALFHRDSYSRKGPVSLGRLAHFWATIYAADAVIAGNAWLRDQAASYIDPGGVHLVPTCVDLNLYQPARHVRHGAAARLVWIGGHSTVECLTCAQSQLAAASAGLPGLELRVICNRFPELARVKVIPRQWSAASESAELADADIGISWLPEGPWSQGKCGLKVLQYMAAGLPVVANPVGMNCDMVLDGETGYLADTPQAWSAAVRRLAADPALRQRMGLAGRQRVHQRYSLQRWAPQFAELVDRLARRGADRPTGESRLQTSDFAPADAAMEWRVKQPWATMRMGTCWSVPACCLWALAGCAGVRDVPATLPVANTIVREPLIIHSDSPLPAQHRLFEDLTAQREELTAQLGLPASDEPIHVYLFDTSERFNAFIGLRYPQFPIRRAFFVEGDTRLSVYAYWGDRVAEDLRHEVAHGYLHAVLRNIPLWLDEGLAEYFEVPRGTNGLNRPHVSELAPLLASEGWRPDLARLETLTSAGDMTQLDYAEAWAWVHWMLRTTPEREEFLNDYLATLHKDGTAAPLSLRLREEFPDAEQSLAEHLSMLGTGR